MEKTTFYLALCAMITLTLINIEYVSLRPQDAEVWKRKEEEWKASKNTLDAKVDALEATEKETRAEIEEWRANEEKWKAKEEAWRATEEVFKANEEAKEKEWRAKEKEWMAKEKEWRAKEKEWMATEDTCTATKEAWVAKEKAWIAEKEEWRAKNETCRAIDEALNPKNITGEQSLLYSVIPGMWLLVIIVSFGLIMIAFFCTKMHFQPRQPNQTSMELSTQTDRSEQFDVSVQTHTDNSEQASGDGKSSSSVEKHLVDQRSLGSQREGSPEQRHGSASPVVKKQQDQRHRGNSSQREGRSGQGQGQESASEFSGIRKQQRVERKAIYLPIADRESKAVALFYKLLRFVAHFYNTELDVQPLTNRHQVPAILPCVGASRLGSDVSASFAKSKLPNGCLPLLILIHPRAPQNSSVFPTRQKGSDFLKDVKEVFDFVVWDDKIYDCIQNHTAVQELMDFFKKTDDLDGTEH